MSLLAASNRLKLNRPGWLKIDYLLIAAIGLALVLVSHRMVYQGFALSDAVVYAVIARNVVEHGDLNTNLYRTDSLVKRGYPTRDYHVPGYVLTLAAAFALFGKNEFVAGLPGQAAYVIAGLIFYGLGKSLFKPGIAFAGAMLFFIFPVNFVYANLVMVESLFTLVTVIYLAFWVKITRANRISWLDAAVLAVILVVGMLYRQTLIFFLPPTVFILAKSAFKQKSYYSLAVFGGVFLILLFGLYWPLAENRSYYPVPLDLALEAASWIAQFHLVTANFFKNILEVLSYVGDLYYHVALINLVVGLMATLLGWWVIANKSQQEFVRLFVFSFWTALFVFALLYVSIVDLSAARNLGAFVLPGLLLLVAAIFKIRPPLVRYAGLVILFSWIGGLNFQLAQNLAQVQNSLLQQDQVVSNLITRRLQPYVPQTVMSRSIFRYAWDHYPAKIIWTLPASYEEMQVVEDRLPVEVMLLETESELDRMMNMIARGSLKDRYSLLFPHRVEGYYFFINQKLESRGLKPTWRYNTRSNFQAVSEWLGTHGKLKGYGISATEAGAGDSLQVALFWRNGESSWTLTDSEFFVELLDENDQSQQLALAQFNSDTPLALSQPGEMLVFIASIQLPSDLSPGVYALKPGLRLKTTGEKTWTFSLANTANTITVNRGAVGIPTKAVPMQYRLKQAVGETDLTLLGYNIPHQEQPASFDFYWQVQRPLAEDYLLELTLLNRSGQGAATWSNTLSPPIHPLAAWQPGEIVKVSLSLPLNYNLPSDDYRPVLTIWPVQNPDAKPVETIKLPPLKNFVLGPVQVNMQHRLETATFGQTLDLLGYDLAGRVKSSGQSRLNVTLYWLNRRPFEAVETEIEILNGDNVLAHQLVPIPPPAGKATWHSVSQSEFTLDNLPTSITIKARPIGSSTWSQRQKADGTLGEAVTIDDVPNKTFIVFE